MTPGALMRMRPVCRSRLGMEPWGKKATSARGSPKYSCASKNATVASWLRGLVMMYQGTGAA
jgi:hypothetical protein